MTYWDTVGDEDVFGLPGMTWEEGVEKSLEEIAPAFDREFGPVLDLGCGPGRLAFPAAKKYGREIIGVDSSLGMLNRQPPYDERVTLLLGDGRTLPLGGQPMGGAYSMLLFQHLEPEQVESYIDQVAKVLLPGAKFRFQYTLGDQHEERSHGYRWDLMSAWCIQAGLKVETIERSAMYDQWEWITAVK